jgi:hypothetical protein
MRPDPAAAQAAADACVASVLTRMKPGGWHRENHRADPTAMVQRELDRMRSHKPPLLWNGTSSLPKAKNTGLAVLIRDDDITRHIVSDLVRDFPSHVPWVAQQAAMVAAAQRLCPRSILTAIIQPFTERQARVGVFLTIFDNMPPSEFYTLVEPYRST